MLTIAQTLHVSQEDFDQLFDNYIEFTPPESEFDRILQFHRLALLMNIDQETSDVELDFLRDIGIRMGLKIGFMYFKRQISICLSNFDFERFEFYHPAGHFKLCLNLLPNSVKRYFCFG